MGDRIFRCADGHFFMESPGQDILSAVHLGSAKFLKCPVDGRWRLARPVSPDQLTPEQVEEAHRVHY